MHVRGTAQARQHAVRNTQDCQAICVQTAQYCVEVGGAHAEASHVRLLQDCADICAASTTIFLRGAQHHADVSNACANLCDACAASCEKYLGDAQMKACANQCRLCASACRQMAATTTGLGEAGFAGMSHPGVGREGLGA